MAKKISFISLLAQDGDVAMDIQKAVHGIMGNTVFRGGAVPDFLVLVLKMAAECFELGNRSGNAFRFRYGPELISFLLFH